MLGPDPGLLCLDRHRPAVIQHTQGTFASYLLPTCFLPAMTKIGWVGTGGSIGKQECLGQMIGISEEVPGDDMVATTPLRPVLDILIFLETSGAL